MLAEMMTGMMDPFTYTFANSSDLKLPVAVKVCVDLACFIQQTMY